MKQRHYQYLQLGSGTRKGNTGRIKVWRCRYVGCIRVLSDVHNPLNTKYCLFHKAIRIKEKNAASYQKKIGCVRPTRMSQILYLLKTNGRASTYELLAFTGIRKMGLLRVLIWNVRKKGHSITHSKTTNYYYQYNGVTAKHEKE